MRGLFWTLFGLTDYDSLNLPPNLHMTEAVGQCIFALYLLLTMVFLMNMLIGMLGGAFTVIQENADTEWKFARSIIMCEYVIDSAVVPPPLNLLPSTMSLSVFSARIGKLSCCRRRADTPTTKNEVEMEVMESKKAASSLDYQILSAALKRRYIRDIMKHSSGFAGHSAAAAADDEDITIETVGEGLEGARGKGKRNKDLCQNVGFQPF
ncbi:short transient receptor potential channel 2 homolog isoform X2 [Amphiura filiformis]|uniref:short transient receptor potential channel 2 homolog isoform X2 n=1 Tax=Amphiura filiformis TaxID=82378 RepID=UPI003B2250E5